MIPTVGPYALPFVHKAIRTDLPDLVMPVEEAPTSELVKALDAGQLDVLMLAELSGMSQRYHCAHLYDEPFYASLPEQHPLSSG